MDIKERDKYLKLISEKDKETLKKYADKLGKKVEEFLDDILTLSVTTKYQGEKEPAARPDLYFDGDIDVILPKAGTGINQQTLDLHQKMVDLAMKNRRELIHILLQLLDLKELVRLI
jgi:hypothetical protein